MFAKILISIMLIAVFSLVISAFVSAIRLTKQKEPSKNALIIIFFILSCLSGFAIIEFFKIVNWI